MTQASDEPISWLLLERYALGELSDTERQQVERRLAASERDRACLESILTDRSELPPLPLPVSRLAGAASHAHTQRVPTARAARAATHASWFGARAARLGGVLAMAAAVGLAFVWLGRDGELADLAGTGGLARTRVKGGELALQLVSDTRGAAPTHFAEGERFKALVSCPSEFDEQLHLFVFQAGVRYEPIAPARLVCGNSVPLPGAFSLDGRTPAEVCVTWGTEVRRARTKEQLGDNAACAVLAAE
jgi:hypothetical protein